MKARFIYLAIAIFLFVSYTQYKADPSSFLRFLKRAEGNGHVEALMDDGFGGQTFELINP